MIYTGRRPQEKVSDEQVAHMRQLRADGAAYATLARDYGITVDHVSAICRGYKRRDAGGPITHGQYSFREPDPWFTAAWMGLSWESAKILAS